ncbi:MAG: hypothetical protein HC913_01110 [Microscillaceae bacterium]|nr:hypothetical protein [Microscillaceae bacterium]
MGVEETTFRDNGPLSVGISYSYVITVNFPEPQGGVSLASTEVCVRLPVVAPVITNVSVLNTATASGEIEVRWIFPPELDLTSFPGPYSYNLYRAEGLTGTNFVRINTLPIPDPAADPNTPLSFTDTGLNTQDLAYRYFVEFFADITGVPTDSSEAASSVRLDATPAENSIILEWNFNVPWSNRTDVAEGVGPHLIYRRTANVGVFQLIDSVNVGQTRYVDVGQFNNECLNPDSVYVYYVSTRGSYFNPTVILFRPCSMIRRRIWPAPKTIRRHRPRFCLFCPTIAAFWTTSFAATRPILTAAP